MNRRFLGLVAGWLVLAVGVGSVVSCKSRNRDVSQEGPGRASATSDEKKPPEKPPGVTPVSSTDGNADRLKQAEKELADLDQTIEAREKELAALRKKANALRQEVVTLMQGAGGVGTFTSPEQLVAGLPEDARPKDHNDTIRIDRANDWLKANVIGKRIQWNYSLRAVNLERMESKKYRVFLYNGSGNAFKFQGLDWDILVYNTNPGSEAITIRLNDIDEAAANHLKNNLKNNTVKLTATVEGAKLGSGLLFIKATDFILDDDIKTGLPRALDDLKSTDPAVRIEAAITLSWFGSKAKEALPDLLGMLKEKDEGLRDAATAAIFSFDPQNKAIADLVPAKAAVDGKYVKLLMRMYVPKDKDSHGDFRDYGYYSDSEYKGYKNVPAGYWVYVYPNWYIWGELKK